MSLRSNTQQIMTITDLWTEHAKTVFPESYAGKDVNGVCLTSLDTYAAGCISTYIQQNRKSIDFERYQVLQKCKANLEEVLPDLTGEARMYFIRLHEMCSIIIAEVDSVNRP